MMFNEYVNDEGQGISHLPWDENTSFISTSEALFWASFNKPTKFVVKHHWNLIIILKHVSKITRWITFLPKKISSFWFHKQWTIFFKFICSIHPMREVHSTTSLIQKLCLFFTYCPKINKNLHNNLNQLYVEQWAS